MAVEPAVAGSPVVLGVDTELASRSASRRAPAASVPGANTANSVGLNRPITSDRRAEALSACTHLPTMPLPC